MGGGSQDQSRDAAGPNQINMSQLISGDLVTVRQTAEQSALERMLHTA